MEHFYGDIILPSNYTITVNDNKKYINSPSNEYEQLIDELAIIAYKHWKDNKEVYNNDKRKLFKYIYNLIKNNYYAELRSIIGTEENVTDLCYAMSCNVLPKK